MPVMQVRIIRKLANFINGVDLSRAQVGDIIIVPVRDGEILIAEGWAAAYGAGADRQLRAADRPRRRKKIRERRPAVLIVDDEVSMHGLLAWRFEGRPYDLTSATSADQAIALLQTVKFDAIVLDVRMPGRSGLDVLTFIRANEKLRHLPVMILTGATLSPAEELVVKKSAVYIFYKQTNLEEFDTYLDRLTAPRNSHA